MPIMALDQTLASTNSNNFFPLLSIHKPRTPFLSQSLNPRNPSSTKQFGTLRCSMDDYRDPFPIPISVPSYPRPLEIPWKKEFCNSVNLIGIVAAPIDTKHFPSGKVLAWTRLAVKKSSTQTSWINLTFWDEMAHVVSQHVEKGHQIFVSGRLVSDTVESDDGKQQTYYKVIVQQLNFIERSLAPVTLYDHDSDTMNTGAKFGNNAANGNESVQELWQAFFANPLEWWDNRKNKRNPKYPDFKHKDTGESLWVEGRYNPPWVKAQLAILDTRMRSLPDQDEMMHANIVAGDEFVAF